MNHTFKVGDLFIVGSGFALIHTIKTSKNKASTKYHCYSTYRFKDYDVCSKDELLKYTDYYTDIFRELTGVIK